ncbi:hypothetical protein LIER_20808 [Lithospermum erythrorhizon]|uniref:Retrotransposon gag domain-containing protein n=1 Tax=Lithospermum erythrorhizon TaxID=34254 RepID=A0AAV3QR01_LITER
MDSTSSEKLSALDLMTSILRKSGNFFDNETCLLGVGVSLRGRLSFWASEDEVYARAFPSSLSGPSLKWFHKLPSNSIEFWQDAMDLFMDKLGASIVVDEDERALMQLKQKPRELLRSYATHFEKVVTNNPTMDEKVAMISFFHG